MVFAIALGITMILSIPITYVIIHAHVTSDKRALFGDELQSNEDDNPLLLTVKAMEAELAELHENNIHMKRIQQLEKDIEEANKHAEALLKATGNYGSTMEEAGESIVGGIGGRNAIHTVAPVDSNGIVVGGLLSKGLVVEKPEEKIESICENESETNKKTREYRNMQRRLAQKKQDKIIREIEELLREADKSIYKAEYGKWNTIPTALSHEERVKIAMEKLNTKRMEEGY